jgi:NADH-quinone oxidoreductase subunit I
MSCRSNYLNTEERKPGEKHLYKEENMLHYMKSICCVTFFVDAAKLSKRRNLSDDLKSNFRSSSYDREDFIYGKDKLVMPLDIAMKNAQLKKTPMSTILIIFVF